MFNMVMWQPGMTLKEMELEVIEASYNYHNQKKVATARALGIAKRTLDKKIKELEKLNAKRNSEKVIGETGQEAYRKKKGYEPGACIGDDVESSLEVSTK